MTIISQNKRYYPHDLSTKFNAVNLYRNGNPISFVCRRYKISKASLMRWNKKFDGTKESLLDSDIYLRFIRSAQGAFRRSQFYRDYKSDVMNKGI